jgi:ribosomal protein S3
MGQKINPNIFRLGINKQWKTEFFEKKRYELPLYTFKDLEIKSYVQRFLEKQGIILHDYKQYYSNSTLHLYISYFVLPEFILGKKSKVNKLNLVNKSSGAIKLIMSGNSLNSASKSQSSQLNLFKTQSAQDYYDLREYLSSYPDFFRLPIQQIPICIRQVKNSTRYLKVEGVLINLFKVLSLFTKNRFNITINFCCLNKNLSFLKKIQTKNLILLQKFKGTPFLTEGIELLFYTLYVSNSANLLAKFISIQIKKVKRHRFFLSFLKQALTILMKFSFSKIKGIKIMVKGRLNGVPRAKHKTISIGDVPVQSINEIVDYSQITIHNSNGSYGIKVWITEKS